MKNNTWMIVGLFFLASLKISAQSLKADFSTNISEGCSPLTISFTNLSVPDTGIYCLWDFGNGETSTASNPVILYTQPGRYTIKLLITNGSSKDSIIKENQIIVYGKPKPDFAINSPDWGCAPYEVDFQNKTQSGDTSIHIYHWDFGDGSISSLENPTHLFNFEASYSVSLYVKDKNNCDNFIVYNDFIHAYKPVANFLCTDSVSCNGFLETSFINKSSGTGDLCYIWDFGDGTGSDQKDPAKKYAEQGTYNVSLIAIDSHTCSDTMLRNEQITIEKLIVNFSTDKDTFCQNENVVFTNHSSDKTNCYWDFGDGSFSVSNNPVHSYLASGSYNVKLAVSVAKGCSEYYTKQIVVENIEADYISSQNFSCSNEVTVQYTDKSINAVSWDWRFGNGIKSSIKNPVNIYTSEGFYIDTLIVKSKHGCSDMKVINPGLTIIRPKAAFTPNNWVEAKDLKGCVPLSVNFKDKSNYVCSQDSIVNWNWNFGDGSTSTLQNPAHTFSGPAMFQVDLIVTTSKGCRSIYSATAKTGTKQKADFIKDKPDVICASTPVQFTDKSENKSLINEWYWIFGDGTNSISRNPKHIFADTGYMEVKLLAYYNGCPAEEVKKNFIYIKGPVVNPVYETSCKNHLTVSFKGNIKSAEKYYWNFGDGSPLDSVNINPTHIYLSRGNYKLKLQAINSQRGCSFSTEKDVVIKDIEAVIDADKVVGCPGAVVSLNSTNSSDEYSFNYQNRIAKFLWNFGDGSEEFISTDSIKHQFKTKGTYLVKLKIHDIRGCEDSVVKQIKIYQPEPGFVAENLDGCMPLKVDFKNNSKTDTTIASYSWNFGDGLISNDINPVHIYTKNGIYDVSLQVNNIIGCSAKLEKDGFIRAINPLPDFAATDQTVCIGDTIFFNHTSNDSISSYLWNFGDGNTSGLARPYHVYTNSGSYPVSLYLKDTKGCDSTITIQGFVDVQAPPTIEFEADETTTNCYPLVVHFTDKSNGSNINKWEWNFGENGSKSYIQNPIHSYTKPGNYNVSLKATTSNGCVNSNVKTNLINIKGPWVEINAPDKGCKNIPIKFIADQKTDVYDMLWFFKDGTVGKGDTVYHSYKNPGRYTPTILLMNDDKHSCDKYITDIFTIDTLKASVFEYDNGQTGCVPFTKNFNDLSKGATSWSWQFGDGGISEIQNPIYSFNQEGSYNTRLIVSNDLGCNDTTYTSIRVHPLPIIQVTNDTLICVGQSVNLMANGAKYYSWYPDQYLNSNQIPDPLSTPKQNIDYQVMGTDSNGCVNYANMNIFVQQVPEIKIKDTTIIIGEIVTLDAYSPELAGYSWTPSYAINNTGSPQVNAQPLETTTYTLTVSDTNKCFTVSKDITINIRKEYTVDVPAAFTPNGDGINDIIYVKGWGVKEVIDFKIYNRFGQLVFESHDKNTGWDGMYKGNNQNIETYTYYAKVRTYEDKIMVKSGTINLLK